jgi:putative transposase
VHEVLSEALRVTPLQNLVTPTRPETAKLKSLLLSTPGRVYEPYGLLAMSVAAGLQVVQALLDAELTATCGPKHAKQPGRAARRHGSTSGSLVLGSRRVPVDRPRARTLDGREVQLATWQALADDDLLGQVVMERMLAGLATRRHTQAAEPVGEVVEQTARATSKSAISRRFVAQTAKALEELLARDLGELQIAALLVDGIHVAERCCVVALAICADGRKVPVGLWEGSTENATVVRHLLADLQARGLDASGGLLVVIDGAKALASAVRSVFGELALIQRCTVHKRRNVAEHLPEADRGRVDARLARAFNDPDPARGLRAARALAGVLARQHPGAAASLREGLEEMFTIRRLGVTDRLARTLSSTNPVESMISVARSTARNVKRWRDGEMVRRWVAAGMLNAERSFRRVKGHADMPVLVAALARHAEEVNVRLTA